MKIIKGYVYVFVLGFLGIICLISCSRSFIVEPVGSMEGSIVFYFYESAAEKTPLKLDIVEFVLQNKINDNNWHTLWELRGKQSLADIVYGNKYDGLTEIVAAQPLFKGANYRVLVKEHSWLNPIGYSAAYFVLDKKGVAVLSSPVGWAE